MNIILSLVVLFFIFGIVYLLYRCHLAHLRRNEQLEQIVKERTFELESKIEQLKQIENELRINEAQQQAIFDAEPDATIISDTHGIIIMVNKQTEVLLGYKTTELVGQSIEILIPPRFRHQHSEYRKAYYASPYPRLMGMGFPNVVALRKDNTDVDVEISLSPIQTGQGFLFASSLRDATERKKFETTLKASEERFRLMANNSPIMIWITDRNGASTFSNQSWLDFVGLTSTDTVTHKEWRKLVHPDDIKTAFVDYYANIHAHTPISAEYRLRHASGEWRWVYDQGVPMFNDLGFFIGYIGSLIDITERKNVETELQIAAIAFESNEAMVITDVDSVILRINAAFSELTGYSAEECIGNKINFLRSGRHDEAFYNAMWTSINHDGSWTGEIWDRRKNGEIYPKWLTITAVTDKNGVVTNYVGTQSDITERKAEEKKIHDLAYYDPLTTLPNRRLLYERMEHSIFIAQRQNKQLAILMLDLDCFKVVNDNLGHLAGDELLQQVALRLSTSLRESDTVARLGGDEFVVMLENVVHFNDAALVAENIVVELSKSFNLTQRDNVQIGVSIGISIYPQHGNHSAQLIANADSALYQAKAKGRNCFVYFSDEGIQQ